MAAASRSESETTSSCRSLVSSCAAPLSRGQYTYKHHYRESLQHVAFVFPLINRCKRHTPNPSINNPASMHANHSDTTTVNATGLEVREVPAADR